MGDFHRGLLPMDQLLLLNHIPSPMDDPEQWQTQIAKRCVLLMKKPEAALDSFACIRLRLRGEEKTKGRKRSRVDATESFRYIERIKSSSKARAIRDGDTASDGNQETTASAQQLVLLTKSLKSRLETGLHELCRQEMIAKEKKLMVTQLDSLLTRQWWQNNQKDEALDQDRPFTTLRRLGPVGSGSSVIDSITLEIIATASGADDDDAPVDTRADDSADQERVAFDCPVVMEDFAVVDYVPSTSLVRMEITLHNYSLSALADVYVGLVCLSEDGNVNDLRCSSSVLPVFAPATDQRDGVGQFSLEVTLPPTYSLLRHQRSVSAMLWLHYAKPADAAGTAASPAVDLRPLYSIPITSVSISPGAFLLQHSQFPQLLSQAKARFFFRGEFVPLI